MTGETEEQPTAILEISDDKKAELFARPLEHFVRFAGLANAGGALATATDIGATAKDGEISNILAVPLALFAGGVACALLMAATVHFILLKGIAEQQEPMTTVSRYIEPALSRCQDAFAVGMVLCFILGCLSGVLVIAFA